MRKTTVVIGLAMAVVVLTGRPQAQNAPAGGSNDVQPPPGWPATIEIPTEPRELAAQSPLPAPSITEPFEIGAALSDPSRSATAVVSMLALMNIGIIPDGAPIRPTGAGTPWRLLEREVRTLIAFAEEDAAAGGDGAHTFADFYKEVSGLAPEMTVDRLAEIYRTAYEAHPDDLVPQLLMGQPIESGMPLSQVQMWLLTVDGFASPRSARRAARSSGTPGFVRARFVAMAQRALPSIAWGTADEAIPDRRDLNVTMYEWIEVVARLKLLEPVVVVPGGPAHEGHAGPGATVNLRARVELPPFISTVTGRPMLVPRARPEIAGKFVAWIVRDDSPLLQHGTILTPFNRSTDFAADGTSTFSYQPKPERARGRGAQAHVLDDIQVGISLSDAILGGYDLPPDIYAFFTKHYPITRTTRTWTKLDVQWHERALDLKITNVYKGVQFNFGVVGQGNREGNDGLSGTLAWQADGTYRGTVKAWAHGTKMDVRSALLGASGGCSGESMGWQDLNVVATPIDALGPTHDINRDYYWTSGDHSGGLLALEFSVASRARFSKRDPCQPEIQETDAAGYFLPFNDAQWTVKNARYGIVLPANGKLVYEDRTSKNATLTGSRAPTGPLAGALNFLNSLASGSSVWYVQIERKEEAP